MKPKQRQRAKRGSVQINERDDRLQLRWTAGTKRFSLSLGLNTALNWHNARKLAAQIEQDIILGQFDPTLAKYKPEPITEGTTPSKTTIELFAAYIESRRADGTSEQAISTRYNALAANLKRFGKSINSAVDALQFVNLLRSRQSPRIANQSLSTLKSFGTWVVKTNGMTENWFADIRPLKHQKTASPKRKPFTRAEVKKLLAMAKVHPTFFDHHDFIMILLYLGLRPSEAIGLRWCDVDLIRGEVTISQTLARDGEGRSTGSARVEKGIKNGIVRTLDLAPPLLNMLKGRFAATQATPESLIFTSARGLAIDDRNFRRRIWKPLCKAADVPYRVPYAARHTVLSHGIENGMTLPQAAYVAGHTDTRMVAQTYGHMINRPKLPDWTDPT